MEARKLAEAHQLTATANKLTKSPGSTAHLAEASRLYRQAFRLGYVTAGYNLACTYQNLGDHAAAVRWFRRTLDAGDRSALMPLAQAELHGAGMRKDVPAALKKLKLVAVRERWFTQFEREQAMLLIARCLLEGWLVKRDYGAALGWLRRAARVGSAEAKGLLSDLNE